MLRHWLRLLFVAGAVEVEEIEEAAAGEDVAAAAIFGGAVVTRRPWLVLRPPPEHELPEELMGPWELQSTVSGYGKMWVECGELGDCGCSPSIGKGRKWSALRQPGGAWRLRFVPLDKLSRPVCWEADVRPDDIRGLLVSGSVMGAPKRGSRGEPVVVKLYDGLQHL